MSKPKVSIVAPIYNVEPYLRKCVDSILAQTLENIEVILVDDGSPDCCGKIADEYAENDRRVKVIHQENAGLGPARNTGIASARGEYIGFVDSDGWVDPQMFEELYNAVVRCNADICFSGMQHVANGIKRERNVNPFAGQVLKNQEEIFTLRRSFYGPLPNRLKCDPLPVSVWNAVSAQHFSLKERVDLLGFSISPYLYLKLKCCLSKFLKTFFKKQTNVIAR